MQNFLTAENIIAGIAIISVVFNAFLFLTRPQISSEKKDALLAQKVEFESQSNRNAFQEMGKRIDDSYLTAKNDLSHVDAKVEVLINTVNNNHLDISVRMEKLETMMDERLPKKII
jgi:hypothetical protein